jgi:hypothetical protein
MARPAIIDSVVSWYDAHDGSGLQEVPARVGAGTITLGSTTGSDTNDPTWTAGAAPYWAFGGTDDYLQHPASDTPTFTQTTGSFTVAVVFSTTVGSSSRTLWSSASASSNGGQIFIDPSGAFFVRAGTSDAQRITKSHGTGYQDGVVRVFALVQDAGTLAAYSTRDGLSTTSSTASLTGTMTHTSPRTGCHAYVLTNFTSGNVYAVLQWNAALTSTDLGNVSSYLLGSYS